MFRDQPRNHFRTRLFLSASSLIVACLMGSAPAHAALYKWTDANGRVVYSDQPPNGNFKTELVQGAAPPSNPNAVKDMAAKEVELKKRQQEAAASSKQSDAQRAEMVKHNDQCIRMQSQARALAAEQIALVRYNAKGEPVYLDEATRRKERAEAEAWVKANCSAG